MSLKFFFLIFLIEFFLLQKPTCLVKKNFFFKEVLYFYPFIINFTLFQQS